MRAQNAAEAAYDLVRTRYEGGLSSYIDVLVVEDSMVELRRTVAGLEARAFTLDVVHRARPRRRVQRNT